MTNFKQYMTSFITSKWRRITVLIIIYTIILTIFFDHNDFTGLLDINDKIDEQEKDGEDKMFHPKRVLNFIDQLIERFTFVVVTISSVGYGDVVPKSRRLRLLNSFFILLLVYVVNND